MQLRFVAVWLGLLCVLVFLIQQFSGMTDLLKLDKSGFYIWQYMTSMFAHANLAHLAGNLAGLLLFGLVLEGRIGAYRVLGLFLIAGLVVNIFSPYQNSLGASGAIYGIMGTLIVLRPLMIVWVYYLPMPMIVAGLVWTFSNVLGMFGGGTTGYIAHLIGLGVGIVYGLLLYKQFGDTLFKKRRREDLSHLDTQLDQYERSAFRR